LLQLHFKRLCQEQAVLVLFEELEPDPLVDYDGSPEHDKINREYSESTSYIALDLISLMFLCNDIVKDAFEVACVISRKNYERQYFDTDSAMEILVNSVNIIEAFGSDSESFVSSMCWLDANVRLPCQLVARTGWRTSISGYHASLLLPGCRAGEYTSSRYETLFRRSFPNYSSYYDGSKFLAAELARVEQYGNKAQLFKAVELFGLATDGIDVIVHRLLQFILLVLKNLDQADWLILEK